MTEPSAASDVPTMTESMSQPAAGQDFEVALESLNQWQIAWRKFRRHRLALIGAVIIGLMIFLAIFGPIIWPYNRLDLKPVTHNGGNPPSLGEPFGTDAGGRSVFVLTVNGARLSLLIGLGHDLHRGDHRRGSSARWPASSAGGSTAPDALRRPDADAPVPVRDPRRSARFFGAGDPDRV